MHGLRTETLSPPRIGLQAATTIPCAKAPKVSATRRRRSWVFQTCDKPDLPGADGVPNIDGSALPARTRDMARPIGSLVASPAFVVFVGDIH
jgi:hypothetical protein